MEKERGWYFDKVGIEEDGRDLLENYAGVPAAHVIEHVLDIVSPFFMLPPCHSLFDPHGHCESTSVTRLSKSVPGHALVGSDF